LDKRPVQVEAEVADFPCCLGSAGLGGCVTPRRERSHRTFYEAELALSSSLEGPEVPWLESMAL